MSDVEKDWLANWDLFKKKFIAKSPRDGCWYLIPNKFRCWMQSLLAKVNFDQLISLHPNIMKVE